MPRLRMTPAAGRGRATATSSGARQRPRSHTTNPRPRPYRRRWGKPSPNRPIMEPGRAASAIERRSARHREGDHGRCEFLRLCFTRRQPSPTGRAAAARTCAFRACWSKATHGPRRSPPSRPMRQKLTFRGRRPGSSGPRRPPPPLRVAHRGLLARRSTTPYANLATATAKSTGNRAARSATPRPSRTPGGSRLDTGHRRSGHRASGAQ